MGFDVRDFIFFLFFRPRNIYILGSFLKSCESMRIYFVLEFIGIRNSSVQIHRVHLKEKSCRGY